MRTLAVVALQIYDYLVVYLGLFWLGILLLLYAVATPFIYILLPKHWQAGGARRHHVAVSFVSE